MPEDRSMMSWPDLILFLVVAMLVAIALTFAVMIGLAIA